MSRHTNTSNKATGLRGLTMTRTILGGIAATALLILAPLGSASAADKAVRAAAPAPAPLFSWTGLYIGGNVGGATGKSAWCTNLATAAACPGGSGVPGFADITGAKASGPLGGAQFGFRWQVPNSYVVLGLEGMFDFLNIKTTQPTIVPPAAFNPRTTTFTDLESITGQVGLAFGKGLIYGKGGWAATTFSMDACTGTPCTTGVGGAFIDVNVSQWVTGWTAGAGVEYMVLENISLGLEYDYYKFNVPNFSGVNTSGGAVVPINPCSFCMSGNTTLQSLVGRVNFKFPG
jgi:outer membrane immunogenic protein